MTENYIMVVFGAVLIFVSIFAKGISYGMPPHRLKPVYPLAMGHRIMVFLFGLVSIGLGLTRLLQR